MDLAADLEALLDDPSRANQPKRPVTAATGNTMTSGFTRKSSVGSGSTATSFRAKTPQDKQRKRGSVLSTATSVLSDIKPKKKKKKKPSKKEKKRRPWRYMPPDERPPPAIMRPPQLEIKKRKFAQEEKIRQRLRRKCVDVVVLWGCMACTVVVACGMWHAAACILCRCLVLIADATRVAHFFRSFIPRKKADRPPFREKFFRQRMVDKEDAQYDLREIIVLRDLDSWVMGVHEKTKPPLPHTPRQPLHLPPIPPHKMLTPAEAMKLWYHLSHEQDDSEYWHNVRGAWRGLRCACWHIVGHNNTPDNVPGCTHHFVCSGGELR